MNSRALVGVFVVWINNIYNVLISQLMINARNSQWVTLKEILKGDTLKVDELKLLGLRKLASKVFSCMAVSLSLCVCVLNREHSKSMH